MLVSNSALDLYMGANVLKKNVPYCVTPFTLKVMGVGAGDTLIRSQVITVLWLE